MHPYSRCAGLPPRGEARNSWLPLRGSCRRLRGCICREAAEISEQRLHRSNAPLSPLRGTSRTGKGSRGSQSPVGSLRTPFACHHRGGSEIHLAPPPGELPKAEGVHLPRSGGNIGTAVAPPMHPYPRCAGLPPRGKREILGSPCGGAAAVSGLTPWEIRCLPFLLRIPRSGLR